jgi:hypothetical protein
VTQEFLSTSLSREEVQDLSRSIHDGVSDETRPLIDEPSHSVFDEQDYRTPGGFPSARPEVAHPGDAAQDLPPTTVLASLLENVLARLQVTVKNIKLSIDLPCTTMDMRASAENGSESSSTLEEHDMHTGLEICLQRATYGLVIHENDLQERVLRVDDVGIWITKRGVVDLELSTAGTLRPKLQAHRGAEASNFTRDIVTLIADDGDGAESMYESAIGYASASDNSEGLDPFDSPSDGDSDTQSERSERSNSASVDDHFPQRYKVCSLGQPGISLSMRGKSDKRTDSDLSPQVGRVASLDLGDISIALCPTDLALLHRSVEVWSKPRANERGSSSVGATQSYQLVTTVFRTGNISLLIKHCEEDEIRLLEEGDGPGHLSESNGLLFEVLKLEASTKGDDSYMKVEDFRLSWKGRCDETGNSDRHLLVSSGAENSVRCEITDPDSPIASDTLSADTCRPRLYSLSPLQGSGKPVEPFLSVASQGNTGGL